MFLLNSDDMVKNLCIYWFYFRYQIFLSDMILSKCNCAQSLIFQKIQSALYQSPIPKLCTDLVYSIFGFSFQGLLLLPS